MRFIDKFFKVKKTAELENIEKSIECLRLGIFAYLHKNKFTTIYGDEEAKFWAAAVMNTLILAEATNNQGKEFYCNNKDKIFEEAQRVSEDDDLSLAVSYLYAAQTIYIAAVTKDPFSERAQEIGEQATRLGIYIPNTYDICGNDDMSTVVQSIANFAQTFLDKCARCYGA